LKSPLIPVKNNRANIIEAKKENKKEQEKSLVHKNKNENVSLSSQ
jgi:hypothetical protein